MSPAPQAVRARVSHQVKFRLRIKLQGGSDQDTYTDLEYLTELPFSPYPRLEVGGKPFTTDGTSMNVDSVTWNEDTQEFVCWLDDIIMTVDRRYEDECAWFIRQGWSLTIT